MRRAAIIVTILALLAGCGKGGEPKAGATPSFTPTSEAGGFVRPPALQGEPCGLEVSESDVWILTCSGTLLRLPKGGAGTEARHLEGEVLSLDGLVAGRPGRLWALLSVEAKGVRTGKLVEIDPGSGEPGSPLDVGASVPMSAAQTMNDLWVAMLDGRFLRIGDGPVHEIDRGAPLIWAASATSELWTVDEAGDATLRDATTGEERSRIAGIVPEAIAVAAAFGALWVATPSTLERITPTGQEQPVDVAGTVNGIEPCGGMVWLSLPDFGVRSVTAQGVVEAEIRLDIAPRYLACDDTTLWVLSEDGRIGSIRIAS
ncbi:MAG: hypothetical protein WEB06_09925 [Actinomycetota bacterium]